MKVIIEEVIEYEGSSFYFVDVEKLRELDKFSPLVEFIEDYLTSDKCVNFKEYLRDLFYHLQSGYNHTKGIYEHYDYTFDFPAHVEAKIIV